MTPKRSRFMAPLWRSILNTMRDGVPANYTSTFAPYPNSCATNLHLKNGFLRSSGHSHPLNLHTSPSLISHRFRFLKLRSLPGSNCLEGQIPPRVLVNASLLRYCAALLGSHRIAHVVDLANGPSNAALGDWVL